MLALIVTTHLDPVELTKTYSDVGVVIRSSVVVLHEHVVYSVLCVSVWVSGHSMGIVWVLVLPDASVISVVV